jgi:hypothetical protein
MSLRDDAESFGCATHILMSRDFGLRTAAQALKVPLHISESKISAFGSKRFYILAIPNQLRAQNAVGKRHPKSKTGPEDVGNNSSAPVHVEP